LDENKQLLFVSLQNLLTFSRSSSKLRTIAELLDVYKSGPCPFCLSLQGAAVVPSASTQNAEFVSSIVSEVAQPGFHY
jgi:hypothetical protein